MLRKTKQSSLALFGGETPFVNGSSKSHMPPERTGESFKHFEGQYPITPTWPDRMRIGVILKVTTSGQAMGSLQGAGVGLHAEKRGLHAETVGLQVEKTGLHIDHLINS
jgi:hypothetical protein